MNALKGFGLLLKYWFNVAFAWVLYVLGISKPIDYRINKTAAKFNLTPEKVTDILSHAYNKKAPKKNTDPYGKRYFNKQKQK